MSGSSVLEELLGPEGALARGLPGYEHRPQQLKMATAVAMALLGEQPLLVEAGTGTGKTLAYLVPAILSGKRVVVLTGTKTLQDQIHRKDLPLLERHLGISFNAVVLKGVSNYLCRRRFAELGVEHSRDFSSPSPAVAGVGGTLSYDPDIAAIGDWAAATTSGDRAELATVPEESPAWRLVTTTPEARLGPRCPFFERCFVTQARRAAGKAQLVIVNHHLFFADLALRASHPGAQVLPDYDAVIFDEAHAVEEVAGEHFGVVVSTARLAALLRDARKLSALDGAPGLLANLEARGEALFHLLRGRLAPALPGGSLFGAADAAEGARLSTPEGLFDEPRLREGWFRLDAALEELAARAARRHDDHADHADHAEEAAAIARRAEAMRADLATVAEPPAQKRNFVHWAELRGRSVFLHATPIDVGALLRERVVESVGAAVFTSATLTTDGSFAYTRGRLGLDPGAADELAVDSPFDYARQALLYLPRDLPGPDEPGFHAATLDRIALLCHVTRGRALVLFTSWRALRHAAAALPGKLPYPILVQGERPRPALLAALKEQVGSVLLATSSFWEGIDVPGEALSLVVLEKLPFTAPDDPLTAARVARLEAEGTDPFLGYQVPRAALALKQGFGRLIRRRDDRGIVAVLDGRILGRAYGRVFLASLPPATRTSSLEQVRRWW